MRNKTKLATAAALAMAALGSLPSQAAQPSVEEKLEILQQELEALKAEISKLKAEKEEQQPAQQQPAQGSAQQPHGQSQSQGQGGGISLAGAQGGSAAQSAAPGSTTVGGYGELIYNNYRDGDVEDRIDFRRFVIFLGHKFTDKLRFFSELEVEHALVEGGEESGAVELEQGYIEYRVVEALNFKVGGFLMPLGIINETHEPPTFYGVERNEVETRIIPSTWREAGVGVYGDVLQGLRYEAGITSSFDSGKFGNPATAIRSTRTELSEAAAHDLALYGALNYRGLPGLLIGSGLFTGGTGQNGATNSALKGVKARATLWDLHAQYRIAGLDLQALYARGSLSDAEAVTNAAIARTGNPELVAPRSFYGWYGQAAYRIPLGDMEFAPFFRYERYNTQASVPSGFEANPKNNEQLYTLGINFKLYPQVVLKADYQNYKEDNRKDRFNLGFGYIF
jgi:hypothetical protein